MRHVILIYCGVELDVKMKASLLASVWGYFVCSFNIKNLHDKKEDKQRQQMVLKYFWCWSRTRSVVFCIMLCPKLIQTAVDTSFILKNSEKVFLLSRWNFHVKFILKIRLLNFLKYVHCHHVSNFHYHRHQFSIKTSKKFLEALKAI